MQAADLGVRVGRPVEHEGLAEAGRDARVGHQAVARQVVAQGEVDVLDHRVAGRQDGERARSGTDAYAGGAGAPGGQSPDGGLRKAELRGALADGGADAQALCSRAHADGRLAEVEGVAHAHLQRLRRPHPLLRLEEVAVVAAWRGLRHDGGQPVAGGRREATPKPVAAPLRGVVDLRRALRVQRHLRDLARALRHSHHRAGRAGELEGDVPPTARVRLQGEVLRGGRRRRGEQRQCRQDQGLHGPGR